MCRVYLLFAELLSYAVGYQNYSLVKGYNLYSPTFLQVDGATALNIQDIKIQGITTSGKTFICLLDEKGNTAGSYFWWLAADAEGKDGWFDDGNWEYYDHNINKGEGFYIYAAEDGLTVQVAGGVKLGNWTVPLQKGYNLVGNCSPVDLDIQNIKLDGIATSGKSFICLLDEKGNTAGSYFWWLAADAEGKDGWFDDGNWEYYTENWPAGKGMYIYVAEDDISLTLPKAL